MAITSAQQYKLKKFIQELEQYRGRHTELVSVYVPAGYDMNKIINHLSQEQGTATNIKSKTTKDNVIAALERMIQHLKLYKKTPEDGLAAFSGNVAEQEGKQDYQVWGIEPPVPLRIRIYRCDKEFVLEPLREMLEIKEVYGLVVLDRRDANIALLKGKTIIPLRKTHSEVPGKMRAGGQSSVRFARLREGATKDHYKKIAEHMKTEFLGKKDLKGIIIGGPSTTTKDFLVKDYLTGELKDKIIGVRDLSYTGDFGLQELLDKSADILAKEEVAEEKKIIQRFLTLLAKKPGIVTYGEKEVMEKLNQSVVETVLVSEEVDSKKIDEIEEFAKKTGTEVRIISTETREGVQLRDLGKIAAILRYEVA